MELSGVAFYFENEDHLVVSWKWSIVFQATVNPICVSVEAGQIRPHISPKPAVYLGFPGVVGTAAFNLMDELCGQPTVRVFDCLSGVDCEMLSGLLRISQIRIFTDLGSLTGSFS